MFKWYRDAHVCYVYLHDINDRQNPSLFPKSEWFERGWTLQELLAPGDVRFYDAEWHFLGTKAKNATEISTATGIQIDALEVSKFTHFSVAEKMSWAANRKTKLTEDIAYCLLGIFDVNMAPIYGEGSKAFTRLQEEIIKDNDDHTIFAWDMGSNTALSGLLAPNPTYFGGCSAINMSFDFHEHDPFLKTNRGLSISLEITPWSGDTYLAFLDGLKEHIATTIYAQVGILLCRLQDDDQYARANSGEAGGLLLNRDGFSSDGADDEYKPRPIRRRQLYIRNSPYVGALDLSRASGFQIPQCWRVRQCSEYILKSSSCHVVRPKLSWCLMVFDLPNESPFDRVALGFDFDLNPICVLSDASWTKSMEGRDQLEDSRVAADDFEYLEVDFGWVYKPSEYNGLWCLRGDRRFGLRVGLLDYLNGSGPSVKMRPSSTVASSLHFWKLVIEPNDESS